MHVVRGGGAAGGAVVEDRAVGVAACEIEHVDIAVPDGLRDVGVAGEDEVVREDRIGVDLDVVGAALAAFELDMELLRGAVFRHRSGRGRK